MSRGLSTRWVRHKQLSAYNLSCLVGLFVNVRPHTMYIHTTSSRNGTLIFTDNDGPGCSSCTRNAHHAAPPFRSVASLQPSKSAPPWDPETSTGDDAGRAAVRKASSALANKTVMTTATWRVASRRARAWQSHPRVERQMLRGLAGPRRSQREDARL